jgi:general secretion pathway protein E
MTTSRPASQGKRTLAQSAAEYGLRCIDAVDDAALDSELLSKLPVEWARENALLPVRLEGKPCLLTSDPAAVDKQEYVAILVGMDLEPVLATRELVLSSIERAYYQRESSPSDFIDDLGDTLSLAAGRRPVDDILEVANAAPVTQLINLILLDAFKKRASDIHIEPFESRLRVRYRVDGILYEQSSPPANMVAALVSRLKVMAHMDIAERRLPQDGMARVRVGEREVDIRVSTVPVAEGERVVLRLLDKENTLLAMAQLGMSDACYGEFSKFLRQPSGIIVVSGPTGSGKTTTLYAALGELDASRKNILTIEDPIEYQLDNIGQIQVKSKIGVTFSNGLRHILRQDPDVILVGETRDAETAEIAIRAALTGHLVFTTLHTNDAAGAIVRLVDMGIEPYLIASCLRGVLAQRLVRKLCLHCRRERTATSQDAAGTGAFASIAGKSVWDAVGCDQCTDGYRGRVGIFELLPITSALRDLVRDGQCNLDTVRRIAAAEQGHSLAVDGIEKVLAGVTTLDEILSVASI